MGLCDPLELCFEKPWQVSETHKLFSSLDRRFHFFKGDLK